MEYILYWILAILAIIIVILLYRYTQTVSGKSTTPNAYLQALEFIISGDRRQAIEKLKVAVKTDTENVDAYIKLGNLLREQGLAKNAVRIHSDLTFRNNISREQLISIYMALFDDYFEITDWVHIKETGKKLLAISKDKSVIFRYLAAVEKIEDWDEAIRIIDEFNRNDDVLTSKRGLYLVMKGLKMIEENGGHDSRLLFKEALKYHTKCAAAYYYIGLSYYYTQRYDDALEYWQKLAMKIPEKSYIAFAMIEKTFYEMGEFPKVETFYKELLAKHPSNKHVVSAMAMLLAKKGNVNSAIDLLEKFIVNNPDDKEKALKTLFKMYLNSNNDKKALELAKKLISLSDTTMADHYKCSICGQISEEPEWYCPKCKSLNSFLG